MIFLFLSCQIEQECPVCKTLLSQTSFLKCILFKNMFLHVFCNGFYMLKIFCTKYFNLNLSVMSSIMIERFTWINNIMRSRLEDGFQNDRWYMYSIYKHEFCTHYTYLLIDLFFRPHRTEYYIRHQSQRSAIVSTL